MRTYASVRQSIRIHFSYRGVACRETLKGLAVTAANLKFARNLTATINHEIATGTFDYPARFPLSKRARKLTGGSPSIKLGALEDAYAEQVRRLYQPATQRSYLGPLRSWVLPTLGQIPLGQIDAAMIRRELKALAARGLKPKSVSSYKTALNKVLDYAVEEGYLTANPALSVSVGRAVGRQEATKDEIDPFTRDEVTAILQAATGAFRNYLRFAFYTGLRTSELYGLRWEDVDYLGMANYVSRSISIVTEILG